MTEIEPYEDRTPAISALAQLWPGLQKMFEATLENASRIDSLEERQSALEMVAAESHDWLTLLGFVIRYNVQPMLRDERTIAVYGQQVARWCRSHSIPIQQGEGWHERWGGVNKYPTQALATFFDTSDFHYDRDRYQREHGA